MPAAPEPAALLWGDPGPHNALVDDGLLSALLDWELSHVGHPLEDLGGAVWACAGVLDPELLVRAYEQERGRTVDRDALAWFECFACLTRSVMLATGVRAYVEGRTRSPALAGLGLALTAENLQRAARIAGWPEPSPAPVLAPAPAAASAVPRPDEGEGRRRRPRPRRRWRPRSP